MTHITDYQAIGLARAARRVSADQVQPGDWFSLDDNGPWLLCETSEQWASAWNLGYSLDGRARGYSVNDYHRPAYHVLVAPAEALLSPEEALRKAFPAHAEPQG